MQTIYIYIYIYLHSDIVTRCNCHSYVFRYTSLNVEKICIAKLDTDLALSAVYFCLKYLGSWTQMQCFDPWATIRVAEIVLRKLNFRNLKFRLLTFLKHKIVTRCSLQVEYKIWLF
jgi:hypothetical protein